MQEKCPSKNLPCSQLKSDKLYQLAMLTHRVIASHCLSIKRKITDQNTIKRLAILPLKIAQDTERVLRSLTKLRAPLQAERKNYGHQHHQAIYLPPSFVGTGSSTFFSIFLDLGMKYYFLLSFCQIGLDLISVLIPFCFRLLGSP